MEVIYGFSASDSSLITSSFPFGACFGCLQCTLFSDVIKRLGYRKYMIIFDLVAIIGLIISAFPNVACLSLSRLIVGWAVGVNTTVINSYSN